MLFEHSVFENKKSFCNVIATEFETGYGFVEGEPVPSEYLARYTKEIYRPYKEKLGKALSELAVVPKSEDEVPTLWMETSDAFDMGASGDFSGFTMVLDALIEFLESRSMTAKLEQKGW